MTDRSLSKPWESLDGLAGKFEAATIPAEQWYHATHLAVAYWYASRYGLAEAESRLREGIRRLNLALGGQNTEDGGYHETLTLFWLRIVRNFVLASEDGPEATLEQLIQLYGDRRDLWREYYSIDVVRSREARAQWIAPDLRSIP
jgi:hypothetical protein